MLFRSLCALLHDLCKAQFYKISSRNVKNEMTGAWEQVPFYSVEDQYPFGHGEKSVFLIERFIRLKPSEAISIRRVFTNCRSRHFLPCLLYTSPIILFRGKQYDREAILKAVGLPCFVKPNAASMRLPGPGRKTGLFPTVSSPISMIKAKCPSPGP